MTDPEFEPRPPCNILYYPPWLSSWLYLHITNHLISNPMTNPPLQTAHKVPDSIQDTGGENCLKKKRQGSWNLHSGYPYPIHLISQPLPLNTHIFTSFCHWINKNSLNTSCVQNTVKWWWIENSSLYFMITWWVGKKPSPQGKEGEIFSLLNQKLVTM